MHTACYKRSYRKFLRPLVGHADAGAAHADDVVDVVAGFLDLDRGKDQRAFLVEVAGSRDKEVGSLLPMSA